LHPALVVNTSDGDVPSEGIPLVHLSPGEDGGGTPARDPWEDLRELHGVVQGVRASPVPWTKTRSLLSPFDLSKWLRGKATGWDMYLGEGNAEPCTSRVGQPHTAVRIGASDQIASAIQPVKVKPGWRLLATCWVMTTLPDSARILVSQNNNDVVSSWHPGDGRWHRLDVEYTTGMGKTVDFYLQMVSPGHATFDEPTLLVALN